MNKFAEVFEKVRDELAFRLMHFAVVYVASPDYGANLSDVFEAGMETIYNPKPAQEPKHKESN